MSLLKSSNQITNILCCINTDKIIGYYETSGKTPSQTITNPTDLYYVDRTRDSSLGGKTIAMFVSNIQDVSGQGTANLSFKANVGDTVRFTGLSEYNNFDNPVLVYKVAHYSGQKVLGRFVADTYQKTVPVLNTTEEANNNLLPEVTEKTSFSFLQASIKEIGTENYNIHFAIYKVNTGSGKPELFGYFKYDPSIIVKQ
jgi:hypothetical protein